MPKNLVQELRELATNVKKHTTCAAAFSGRSCNDFVTCSECVYHIANLLAYRIEAEYEPKPEPDTVEKVALDMLKDIIIVENCAQDGAVYVDSDTFRERLEALGVKVDD